MKLDTIQLGHGGGGLMSGELIDELIVKRFGDGALTGLPDAAALKLGTTEILFSTDSFVVSPKFFPGGNIGDLAVHGTVNDISVSGGRPVALSLGLILEEGLSIADLEKVLDSIKLAADYCGVSVVTGDTKVVARGECDGIYINTAGIGERIPDFNLSKSCIQLGDKVIVSGTLGDHGMAVMAAREGFDAGNALKSDSAPVNYLVASLAPMAEKVRFMRDPTRGGLAATLNEVVAGQSVGICLEEGKIPFSASARGLAEAMGLDLLHVASEGRMVCVCAPDMAENIVRVWRDSKEGIGAAVVGTVTDDAGKVILQTSIGGQRIVDVPGGEILPRIC